MGSIITASGSITALERLTTSKLCVSRLFFILVVFVWLLSTFKFVATLTGIVRFFSERPDFERRVIQVMNE